MAGADRWVGEGIIREGFQEDLFSYLGSEG